MRAKAIYLQIISLIFLVVLSGCFSSHPEDIEAFQKPDKVELTADRYILNPPDEIEIHALRIPEINLQRQQIRPDGKVMFEGLGEIHAAGKTPNEVAELIREKAMQLYTLATPYPVDVRIVVYKSHVYYVLGQVYFPGAKVYTGRDTVIGALAEARPTVLAWLGRVQVVRPSADKKVKPKIFEVDFDRMSAHGDISKNVFLQKDDIVYVPPTVLAGIGLMVEELVRPIGRAFGTYNIVQSP